MLFTLLFTISAVFTIKVVSTVAYVDQNENEYKAYQIIDEKTDGIIYKISEKKNKIPQSLQSIKTNIHSSSSSKSTTNHSISIPIASINIANIEKPKQKPIKTINDPFFLKHVNRICELEAITHKSILDMYDHEEIFKKFSDIKMLARNLAWEQQQARQRAA